MTGAGTFVRFCIVGALVAGLYMVLYLFFLAMDIAQPLANAVAFLIAVALQYVGQAKFSFGQKLRDGRQVLRFSVMIGLGLVTAAILTGVVAPTFNIPDWAAALSVMLVLPVQNFVLMALWVFSQNQLQAEQRT